MNDIMDQIIESLAFEIEAVPNETKGEMSTGFYNDPINLKIRIKNKDQNKILRQGVISLPKRDDPTYSSDKIQLSNSDQTIMSFNVLMDRDVSTNKQQKHKRKFRFFKRGNCLGNQTEEDQKFPSRGSMDNEQLAPIKSTSINDMNKRNFTLTKMYGNSDTRRMENRTHKDILGKCKPGGCLDPPYSEDKYSYVPKLIQISRTEKNSSKRKSNDVAYQKSINKNENKKVKDEIRYVSEKKEQLSLQTNINLSNTKHSNSIITYPSMSSNESLNKGNIKKSFQHNDNNSKLSNISNEIVETYFISPKKIKNRHDELQEDSIINIGAEKHSFVKPLSKDPKVFDESNPDIIKTYENTRTEGNIADPKISIQSDDDMLNDTYSTSQTSLTNLSGNEKNVLNPVQNEVYTKSSLTSLNNRIPLSLATDSLKVSSNPIPMFSASPKMIYKVSSDTTIAYTNNSVEQVENNEEERNKKSSLDTLHQDQSFISKEVDNVIEMTEHEKEKSYKENRNDLELEHLIQDEEVKIINKLSSNESADSNKSLNRQNEITKEITNLDTGPIIPDTATFSKKTSSKISIMSNDLAQKENIATLNQDLIMSVTKMNQNLNSDFSYVNIQKSISLTETDNDPQLEQKHEQTLLDTKFDSNILSNGGMKEASLQEIETKHASLTERNEIQNSMFSNDVNEAPIENIADDVSNNFTVSTGLKESNDQVVLTNDNDLQTNEQIETENVLTHDTSPDKTSIQSVKSYIDNSSLFIDIQDTKLGKMQSSPLATQSLTSMEKYLTEYNTLQSLLLSEPKAFDSASAPDGIVHSANIDIAANSINETVEIISLVNNNLDPENGFIEKIKSRSNLSLSINESVNTPSPENIQIISEKNNILTEVSTDDLTKLKSDNLNNISSANEVNLQSSQEPFVKLVEDESFKHYVGSATAKSSIQAVLEVPREEVSSSDVETSRNVQSSDIRETSITITDNNTNKTNERDLICPLSKDSNLKDTVYLNMAFQSFYSEKDGNVIRTIETTNKDVERYEDDNILQLMTLAKLGDFHISIPVDSEKKLLLQITKTSEKDDQNAEIIEKASVPPKQDPKLKLVAYSEDNDDTIANSDLDKKIMKDSIKNSTKSEGNIQLTLDNVYNQKLLPLHNIIKDLKRDIDRLLKHQLIKHKLHNDPQIPLRTISKNYKTCICIEQLFLKH